MCGLGGYVHLKKNSFTIDQLLLEHMQQQVAHRGPNGYRIWQDQSNGVGFFHRRLSIVDLSEAGFQPMTDAEKSIIVICNGEIYNHPHLRKELEALGYCYSSNSDTETIVHAYKEWGINALNKLDGMFSIVIFDKRTNELYFVRDRLGIKPLYFSVQGDVFSFASEIKALWPLPWITKQLNTQALYHYLTYLVTPAPFTLFKDVYKIPAAHYVKIDAERNYSFHEWYTPLKPTTIYEQETLTEQYCVKKLRSLLRNSVQQQMMSDVPYGVFLSGGIDSSLNVALMSEFTEQVKTFNVSFDDGPEYSEINWARKIARRFNTDHHEIIISEKEAFEFFEKMVHHQDEPLADCVCVPLYYVSKLLKDAGVTVVQVGEGSDELFCGYSTYATYVDYYNRYWKPSQKFIPAFAKQSAYHILSTLFPQKQNRLDMIKNWADGKSFFWSGATAFSENWKKAIFNKPSEDVPEHDAMLEKVYPGFSQQFNSYAVVDYHLQQLRRQKPDADFLTSMIYLELKQRLPELLLMRVDKMTMATSVEARVPFLDHNIVEFALQIPSSLKYKDGITKYILKKACEGILPQDIIYRPKMGFAAPTKRWFKQGTYFKPYFLDLLHSKEKEWQEYLKIKEVTSLFEQNQKPDYDCSVQLWTLQNLIANQVV